MQRNRILVLTLTIILCSVSTLIWGQPCVVKGNVWEISSGRKPVYGVSIKFIGAEEVTSGIDGSFEVRFDDKKTGDTITLEFVQKANWELVQGEELANILITPDRQLSINIFVAFKPRLNYRKTNLYNSSKEILLLRLEEIQLSLQNKLEAGEIPMKLYQDSLSITQSIFEAQNQRLALISENLAELNSDQLPIPVVEALSLFEAGKILEAIDSLDSYIKFIEANSDSPSKLPEYLQSAELLAQLWGLYLQPNKGVRVYIRLLSRQPENLTFILKTAAYFHQSGDYAHAKSYYLEGLDHPAITLLQKVNVYLRLGEVLSAVHNISKALSYNRLSASSAKKLFTSNSNSIHKYGLSQSYLRLAQTFTHPSIKNPDSTLHYILRHTNLSEELSEEYAIHSNARGKAL